MPTLGKSWRAKKCSKTFFKVLEGQNMQNQTIFELYTDDNKLKYSSNPKDTFKSAKTPYTNRNSHLSYSIKKGVLKNFVNFKGKHQCQTLLNFITTL